MRKGLFIVFILFIVPISIKSFAEQSYSTISTQFEIKKVVESDLLFMKFKVWAKGDNYAEALKRLKPINNDFVGFLRKIYKTNEIQTQNSPNYSSMASFIITVRTVKINSAGSILSYISKKHFPYKTGIELLNLSYQLSYRKTFRIRKQLFRKALIRCKDLLRTINQTIGKNYQIGKIDVNYSERFQRQNNLPRLLLRSASAKSPSFKISSGEKIIKAEVMFSAVLPIK